MKGSKTRAGKTPSGAPKWRLRVFVGRDGRGKQRYETETYAGTAKEADARLRAMVREVEATHVDGTRTFRAVLEHWRKIDSKSLSPTTLRGYEYNLVAHVEPVFGDMKLSRITTSTIELFYAELEERGLKPRTVHQVHSALAAVLSCAVRNDWITRNPARAAKRTRLEKWHPPAPLDADAIPLLLKAASDDADFHAILLVAIATGARRGELCALRWSELDLEAGTLRIARSIAHGAVDHGELVEKSTKTHAARIVPLPSYAVDALRARRERAEDYAELCATTIARDGYVFSDEPRGRDPWRPDLITARFVRARRISGVAGSLRFHDLRHFAASDALDRGATLAQVRDLLGHGSISTTDRYVDRSGEHGMRALADRNDEGMRALLGI